MSVEGARAGYEDEDVSALEAGATFTRMDAEDECILAVNGDVDIASSAAFRRSLDELLDLGHERAGVDLSGVIFMDSSALSVLVHAHERARELGLRLELLGPSPACAKVLSITGLDRVFDVR
jgi:anti-sigma B factor antagonist